MTPQAVLLIALLLVMLGGGGYWAYSQGHLDKLLGRKDEDEEKQTTTNEAKEPEEREKEEKEKLEVYHVSGNPHAYAWGVDDAHGVCTRYGGTMATKAQVEAAQKKGAQWCSTGWTKDGGNTHGMYPMQQKLPGCGAPGMNFFTPDNRKAGVNCYGVRPSEAKQGHNILPFS